MSEANKNSALKDYRALMEEYTDFLERMTLNESEKLAALSSGELPRIEHSISVSQANAKQLENYEMKRVSLQRVAGYAGKSFKELVDEFEDDDERASWERLFSRFEHSVLEIRFRNDKSMTVARDNMMMIDPSAVLPGTKAENPYKKIRKQMDAQTSIMETKV